MRWRQRDPGISSSESCRPVISGACCCAPVVSGPGRGEGWWSSSAVISSGPSCSRHGWATATSPMPNGWPAGLAGTIGAAMSDSMRDQLPPSQRAHCRVVGDLMADLSSFARDEDPLPAGEWVADAGIQARQVVDWGALLFEAADRLAQRRPGCRFFCPWPPPPACPSCALQAPTIRLRPITALLWQGGRAISLRLPARGSN